MKKIDIESEDIQLENCIITGFPIERVFKCIKDQRHQPFIMYHLKLNGQRVAIDLRYLDEIKEFSNVNQSKLRGLVLNNKQIPKADEEWEHTEFACICPLIYKSDLENYLKQADGFLDPVIKLERIFLAIVEKIEYPGAGILFRVLIGHNDNFYRRHFVESNELNFYIRTLENQGLITIQRHDNAGFYKFKLSYKGLLKSIELKEEGLNSNKCFVAMSFDKEDEVIFNEAIEPACNETNFHAIRVDRIHTEAEQTINDLIIAEIKKSKFLISDFTKQKNGVYFEAGYGLGRGKKVIYTCRKDYFNQLHFDVNHFPILIYETTAELKEMLINKINAFIKE